MTNETDSDITAGRGEWRAKTHEIIFGHQTRAGWIFDIWLLIAIVISVMLASMETLPNVQKRLATDPGLRYWFFGAEVVLTLMFAVEYALRVWCVEDWRKYVFSFFGIVDLLAVLPTLIGITWYSISAAPETGELSDLSATGSYTIIRSLRLLRIFRLIRIGRLEEESIELAGAVWKARTKVVVFLLVVLITVVIAGTLMYELEHRDNQRFQSIPEGIYWAIVTMTTVGYGDIVPTTYLGKFISSLLILIGYSLIIVPTGFVSAEAVKSPKSRTGGQAEKPNPKACPACQETGHPLDARYCYACGRLLES